MNNSPNIWQAKRATNRKLVDAIYNLMDTDRGRKHCSMLDRFSEVLSARELDAIDGRADHIRQQKKDAKIDRE